eukprot:31286-Eustigmatos_ZCMA.PRE.1
MKTWGQRRCGRAVMCDGMPACGCGCCFLREIGVVELNEGVATSALLLAAGWIDGLTPMCTA